MCDFKAHGNVSGKIKIITEMSLVVCRFLNAGSLTAPRWKKEEGKKEKMKKEGRKE